jgi:predicted dehydrogenase
MASQLSIGILGTGFSSVHAERLKKLEDVKITAVWGRTVEKARAFNEKMGLREAATFDDFDTMLAQAKFDALYVCLPPHAHTGQVEKAAERGIHLFLEKPIAYDVARAESMATSIEKAGVVSLVGYLSRYRESVEAFKGLIDSGAAGQPTQFQGRYWTNMLGPDWWRRFDSSHGQIFEQVIHVYDMALNLLGEPESVCAFADNLVHRHIADYTIEDTSAAIIRFKNGALASIVGSNTAMPGHYLADFRAVCEHAALDYRSTGQEWITPPSATLYRYEDENVTSHEFVETRDPYLAETLEFLAAIRGQAKSQTPVQVGVMGVRLVSAVLESAAKQGMAIKLS